MLVLSTVEAQLSLHKHNISQKHGNAKKLAAIYEQPNSETAGATIVCVS